MQATTNHATRPTQVLVSEHEAISKILDCLEKLAEDAARSAALDVRSAKEVLDFLGTFADRCHHGKEENALFPMLGRKGLPKDVGPVAVMLSEHEQGRADIRWMAEAVASYERGRREEASQFALRARDYVELLRGHIAKENEVLFPMADKMLSESEQKELLEAFGNVESEDMGAGTHERYLSLVDGLVARLGVTPSPRPPAGTHVCCGHGAACH